MIFSRRGRRRGVTLIEMLIVVSLIGLMAGITYPAVSAGVDSLRLSGAADAIATSMNAALNRAQRRQEGVEIEINRARNTIALRSAGSPWYREMTLPDSVAILRILPEDAYDFGPVRRFLVMPGGAVPRIGVVLGNRRGARKLVRVDPITGATEIGNVP